MVGYSEMLEVPVWIQTKVPAEVQMKYWNIDSPDIQHVTKSVNTIKDEAFTALLIADTLEPGNKYKYQIIINGIPASFSYETTFQTQPIWRWRGDPPHMKFLIGSCAYINEKKYDRPGNGYGGEYEIYNAMYKQHPDFMIWLGDNVYLREPDWNSKTGIHHRYTHTRSTAEMQPFLASTHNYAIWDDHDYGPNDSDRGFWNKKETYETFKLFWANPSYGVEDTEAAITSFQWGDADFFLLDNRTFRSPDKRKMSNKTQLGEKQIQWLFDNLATSEATFKFVVLGGQFLTTSETYESYNNFGFGEERQRIIDYIQEQEIENVIFLTGDVHFSEVSMLKEEGKPTIYDITTSPLNSGVNIYGEEKDNSLRVQGSVIMKRNFAEIDLSGPSDKRTLTLTYFDSEGKEIWKYQFVNE
jgi:alkaline phosphatase D